MPAAWTFPLGRSGSDPRLSIRRGQWARGSPCERSAGSCGTDFFRGGRCQGEHVSFFPRFIDFAVESRLAWPSPMHGGQQQI